MFYFVLQFSVPLCLCGKKVLSVCSLYLLFLMTTVVFLSAPAFAQTTTTLRGKTIRPTSSTLNVRLTSSTLSNLPVRRVRPTTSTLPAQPLPSNPPPFVSEQQMDKIELSTSSLSEKISRFKEDAGLLNEWLKQPGAASKIAERDLRLTQAKLDLVDRKLSRLQLTAESRRHETRSLCLAEVRRSDLVPPELFAPSTHIDDGATSTLLGQAFQASLLQEQFAEENIRALESTRTNLQLDVARLIQFDRYAKLKPDELAVE